MAGVAFGIHYDPLLVEIVDYGPCADLELPSAHWPGPQEGTAVTWLEPRTDFVNQVYWMAAVTYYQQPTELEFTEHPSQGPYLADDGVPPLLYPIFPEDLGRFGFAGAEGFNPCAFALKE